jgi:GR25 family glycosyltransferase involved in LPS biosynthesis
MSVKESLNYFCNFFLIRERNAIGEIFEPIPVFVINLKYNHKRLNRTIRNLKRMGIRNFQIFEAIEDPIGTRGCSKSHLAIWQSLQLLQTDVALVCEDDFKFIGNLNKLRKTLNESLIMSQIKFVALAGITKDKSVKVNQTLKVTHDLQAAACYLVKRDLLDELIKSNQKSILELTKSNGSFGSMDKVWKAIQIEERFAVPIHKMCRQYYGYSDIKKRRVFYEY